MAGSRPQAAHLAPRDLRKRVHGAAVQHPAAAAAALHLQPRLDGVGRVCMGGQVGATLGCGRHSFQRGVASGRRRGQLSWQGPDGEALAAVGRQALSCQARLPPKAAAAAAAAATMRGKQSKVPAASARRAGSHVKVRETQAEAAPAARACQAGAGAAASMGGARKCVCRHARVERGGEGPAAAALARDRDRCHAVVVAQHPCTCRSSAAELGYKTAIQCMRAGRRGAPPRAPWRQRRQLGG